MNSNRPRKHHYVPQFFLRNFATDDKKKHILTVAKEGSRAVWSERAIKSIGFEDDFYITYKNGIPISVEEDINLNIETPISQSDTWAKIKNGCTEALDNSDRAILYALVKHLESRTPHYQATRNELVEMATNPVSNMPFTDEEREYYAFIKNSPESAKMILNRGLVDPVWTQSEPKSRMEMP